MANSKVEVLFGRKNWMKDPNRIKPILQAIEKVWRENPNWTLGQLIDNVLKQSWCGNFDIFFVEDEDLFNLLRNYEKPGNRS